ncbi:unnamed protein product, partial [Ixodes hexagonus]
MAAHSSSADATLDGGGADTGVPGAARVPTRGPASALRSVKRTVVQETVSKSVTERKESTKQITDNKTGAEQRRDSHIETNTTEEVRCKRQEETTELYDGAVHAAAGVASSEPALSERVVKPPHVETSFHDIHDVASPTFPEKKAKLPVAIRVKDDERAAPEDEAIQEEVAAQEGAAAPSFDDHSGSIPTSILRLTSNEESEKQRPSHRLGWQQQDELERSRAALVQPPGPRESKEDEDEDEVAEPPPTRLNMRRKDSIAVAKLRIMRQQENPSEEEEPEEEEQESEAVSPDKRHTSFLPPTVISILSEQTEEESEHSVQAFSGKPDAPAGIPFEPQYVAGSSAANLPAASPMAASPPDVTEEQQSSEAKLEQGKTDSKKATTPSPKVISPEEPRPVTEQVRIEKIDLKRDAVTSENQEVEEYEHATVTRTDVDEVVTNNQTKVQVISQVAESPSEPLSEGTSSATASPPVATVAADVPT